MSQKFLSDVTLSTVTAGSMLKLDANGKIVAAVDGTDYISSAATGYFTASSGSGIYYDGDVRIGTYQTAIAPDARLHIFDYQTVDPKLLIEDGNTGDASMEFKISTQSFTMGIDNSDSDKFVIAAASGFGLSNVLEIATTGLSAFQNSVLVKGSLFINNQELIQQGATEKIASFQNLGTERGYFEVTDTGKGYFYADGFKTGATTVGFLKSDGSVDTSSYATSADINSFIEIGDVATYLSTNSYLTQSAGDSRYATAAQGALADSALQSLPTHYHDGRYYTKTESDNKYAKAGDNFIPINADGFFEQSTEGVVLGSASEYRGLAFPNGGRNFVFEVSIKGNSLANHQGIFWGLDALESIYNNGEAGYKLTHQGEGQFHIRDIASNSNQATSQDVLYAPNDNQYHRYKIISYVDPSNANKALFKVWVDGTLIFNAPQFAAPPQVPTYFGFINYTGDVTFSNWNVREITGEDELALLYGDGVYQPAGNYLTSLPAHHHDARYYTETEMDGFLAGKLSTSGGTISKTTNTAGTDGTTFLEIANNVGGDISQQQSFIDFKFTDTNANWTPQVRIGAQVGRDADANAISKEGAGAFVVYTGNGTDESGGGSLTEAMRVSYNGKLTVGGDIYSGSSKMATESFATGEAQAVQDNLDTLSGALGSNAYTSYTDHTGLYDTIGSAAAEAGAVQDNLDSLAGSLGNAAFTSASDYATASHNHDSDYINVGGDTMTGILKLNAGVTNNNWSTFTHLEGAYSLNNPSGTGGAIRIELPTAENNTNTMMSMTVKVYEYSTGKSFTLFLGGYNYYNGQWYNTFASMVGDNERGDVPVKFGNNGARNIVWIGNPDWSWSYPNVWVTDFQSGHTQGQDWNDGWRIVFDETDATNVTASQTAHKQITTNNIGSASVNYATSAGSATSATTAGTANTVVSTAASGSVLMKHNNSEANAWIFQEAAPNWGVYWFNTGSQSGQSIGNRYTTVGAEMFGFRNGSSQSAIQAPQGWDGVNSNTYYQWMISNYTGSAYFNNDVESRTGFYVNGNIVATQAWVSSQGYLTSLPSHNHDDRYYTESESDTRFLNTSGDTATGLMTFSGGIDYEYAFYQGYAWYKRFYVRSVGLTGSAIANSWVLLGVVRNQSTYERTDIKFRIRGYDDVSSGTEIIQLRVENNNSAQEIHQLYWYADDATPNLFREVKSVIVEANGLNNTYLLWVKMLGDWTDTFTVEAEVFNSHSRPFEFDDVTVLPEGEIPEVPVSDITKTERVWYTSNASIHTTGGKLATESFVTGQGYITSVPSEYLTQTEGDARYLQSVPAEYLTQTEGDARYLQSLPAHNHDTLYDTLGSANAVATALNERIDTEVFDAIATVDSNIPTNNNQLTNGAGYITSADGGNAATLDGIDSTGFVKQLSDTSSPNYFTPSSRRVNPNTTNPTNEHYAVSTFGNNGNVTGQIATHFQTGKLYSRGYNSSWSAWNAYATESYVNTAVSNLVDTAPATLNTLNELAAALGDDANFSTTVANNIGAIDTRINDEVMPYIADVETTANAALPKSGGTMTGDLRVTNGDNNGIRFHSDGANITSVSSGDVVIQRLTAGLRFGSSGSWDYNQWAGIKYDSDTDILTIGSPASGTFSSNSNPPRADVRFSGIDSISLGDFQSTGANGRTVLIEGKAGTTNGEGSGRIFFSENNTTAGNLYGLSLYYEGDGNAVLPSGFNPNTGNATWSLRQHNNSLNGESIIYGSRGNNNVYFGGNLYVPNVIYHTGDTNTYMQFHAADQWRVVTGGAERLEVQNGSVNVQNDFKVAGSYTELGNAIGSVSNDGGWNARLNVAGSSHARLDVKSVSDGIITTMYAHTGHAMGKVGTMSNHALGLMTAGSEKVILDAGGNMLPVTDRTQWLGLDTNRWQIVFCEILDSAGQHEKNLQNPEGEKSVGEYETGTVLVWKGGKNVPCTTAADHMRMGIAVKGIDSPLIQGAEPVLVTGAVNEGDYLVTSTKEGHAEAISPEFMRQHNLFDCVLGKALESAEGESHLVKTWINI